METKLIFDKPLIIFKIKSNESYQLAQKICKYLIESNYIKYIYVERLSELNSEIIFENKENEKYFKSFNLENEDSNICIIIGGDGTCLWANSLFKYKKRPPFLCFHGGTLGFLAFYDKNNYKETVDDLYNSRKNGNGNSINFLKRQLVECDVYETQENPKGEYKDFNGYKKTLNVKGINEISVEKNNAFLKLDIYLHNDYLTKVLADGIIVATSTGSTAYNISAGGPILHNKVEGIILNAICPFSLSLRPIVFPKGIKIRIKNNTEYQNETIVRYDGISVTVLKDNQYVEIYLSDYSIDFIILNSDPDTSDKLWIQKLSNCLKWNSNFDH